MNNWQPTENYGVIARKLVGRQILGEDLVWAEFKMLSTSESTPEAFWVTVENSTCMSEALFSP